MITFPKGLSTSEVDGETVILDQGSQRYFGLNASGSRILALLRQTGDLERSLDALEKEYAADRDLLRSDALELLCRLKERGLVETDEV